MKGWLLANVSNNEMEGDIHSDLVYFVHAWNISNIVSHKGLLNFILLFIFKFRFDWVYSKITNDTQRYTFDDYKNELP